MALMEGKNPLARLRVRAMLSQREAAVRVGVTFQHLYDVEAGSRVPSEAMLESMAQVYASTLAETAAAFLAGWPKGRCMARVNRLKALTR